jgi:hypothetical protein
VFRYNPVTDTISTVPAPWPPGDQNTLPGGFSIFNNKLFILGGFDVIAGEDTNQIWEFTPSPAGWVQKSAVLPVPRGYIPTTTIGSLIYTGGGSDITGGLLTDTTDSFVYDPVADSIANIAPIPRPTGETRALNFNGQMLVMGGGRTAPNPSNEVDAYNPGTNSWTVNTPIPAFVNARRNFPTDTDGTGRIWLAGGYAPSAPTASMEIFDCATPTPTPTPGQIVLTATVERRFHREVVHLRWTGATSDTVNVFRNGARIATVQNTGRYSDLLTQLGTYRYQVCEAHTQNCSNGVTVRFRP